MTAHTPLCLNCNAHEVAGAFTNEYGEGFCSLACYDAANTEAADHFAHPMCEWCEKFLAEARHPEGQEVCRGCWSYEDEDRYWEQNESCAECGEPGRYYEGLCYQCQTDLHEVGAYDMDGDGWQGW